MNRHSPATDGVNAPGCTGACAPLLAACGRAAVSADFRLTVFALGSNTIGHELRSGAVENAVMMACSYSGSLDPRSAGS